MTRFVRQLSLLLALASASAVAGEPQSAEVVRLQEQMDTLAQRNAWSGVERTFDSIVALGTMPDRTHTLLAAEASRQRGDVLTTVQRMLEAQSMEATPELAARIDDIDASFGRVQLKGKAPLTIAQMPFRPDASAAVRYASEQALGVGTFDGFLPVGSYQFGDLGFRVAAGQEVQLITFEDPNQVEVEDITLAGVSFPNRAVVGGHRLVLNGVGVRSKMAINVYAAGLYLTEATTDATEAIRQDLPKRLVMEFVFRKVSRTATVDHFRQSFERMKLADNVWRDVEAFLALLEDMAAGDRVAFDYLPGKGTLISIKGRKRATIQGKPFMWALFAVYLGDDPPTEKLKRGLLGQ